MKKKTSNEKPKKLLRKQWKPGKLLIVLIAFLIHFPARKTKFPRVLNRFNVFLVRFCPFFVEIKLSSHILGKSAFGCINDILYDISSWFFFLAHWSMLTELPAERKCRKLAKNRKTGQGPYDHTAHEIGPLPFAAIILRPLQGTKVDLLRKTQNSS